MQYRRYKHNHPSHTSQCEFLDWMKNGFKLSLEGGPAVRQPSHRVIHLGNDVDCLG